MEKSINFIHPLGDFETKNGKPLNPLKHASFSKYFTYEFHGLWIQLLPKVKVDIVLAEVPVESVVQVARKVLFTGHIGDGKIFVYDVLDAVKIRTGAVGYDAMQGLQD